MTTTHRGRLFVEQLAATDGDAIKVVDPISPDGAGNDIRSGTNVVRRLNVGRVVVEVDSDHTLAVAADSTSDIDGTVLLYNTALTAARAVNLTVAGAVAGMTYRIVRQAGATGAFALNVGSGPLKNLSAASQWCDVTFDGTAWVLSANGSL